MKAIGVEKARRRLGQAKSCLARMVQLESDPTPAEFADEWSIFLNALNSVPEILMTSSRSNPATRQWFDIIRNREIRKDPLLRFLTQARGTDFHGLEAGTAFQGEVAGIAKNPLIRILGITMADGTKQDLSDVPMLALRFEHRLVAVEDHRGNVFEAPILHLDRPIPDEKPSTAARLALDYYSDLLEQAASKVA